MEAVARSGGAAPTMSAAPVAMRRSYLDRQEDTDKAGILSEVLERSIIGRTAAMDWYQLASGWVKSGELRLSGACYNIPLVNPTPGSATRLLSASARGICQRPPSARRKACYPPLRESELPRAGP